VREERTEGRQHKRCACCEGGTMGGELDADHMGFGSRYGRSRQFLYLSSTAAVHMQLLMSYTGMMVVSFSKWDGLLFSSLLQCNTSLHDCCFASLVFCVRVSVCSGEGPYWLAPKTPTSSNSSRQQHHSTPSPLAAAAAVPLPSRSPPAPAAALAAVVQPLTAAVAALFSQI